MKTSGKLIACLLFFVAGEINAQEWYKLPEGTETRWASFENPSAARGKGGAENKKAKGHPSEMFAPGETKTLLNTTGAGVIQRIWMTISDRTPKVLRAIRIEMYWDGSTTPAVSVPLGDFFGVGLGRKVAFQNAMFSDPEGRSFNSYVPMPYRKSARIVLVNESDKAVNFFYDVNYQQVKAHGPDVMYFHAYWNRIEKTELAKDFIVLPSVKGKGRYLGMNMGIITDPLYEKSWWGEGEVKIYLDGDKDLPTLNGTGTEDYIGTGWGQGAFAHDYQGCLIADEPGRQWAFYRYHIPDPVFFAKNCEVAIQIMGGEMTDKVRSYAKNGAQLIPVTVAMEKSFVKLFEMNPVPKLTDENFPQGWTNFYRSDDVSAIAYFYLDSPVNGFPALPAAAFRSKSLNEK
ncbi:MAG: glycoside hydrolase family 172 protein [Cyclobacteriaceae bacterium]